MGLDKVNTLWQSLHAQQVAFIRPHSDRDGVMQATFVVSELIADT